MTQCWSSSFAWLRSFSSPSLEFYPETSGTLPRPPPSHHLAASPTSPQHPVLPCQRCLSLMKSDSDLDVIFLYEGNTGILHPTIIPWPSTSVSQMLFLLFWPEFFREPSSLSSCTVVTDGLFFMAWHWRLIWQNKRLVKTCHQVSTQRWISEGERRERPGRG